MKTWRRAWRSGGWWTVEGKSVALKTNHQVHKVSVKADSNHCHIRHSQLVQSYFCHRASGHRLGFLKSRLALEQHRKRGSSYGTAGPAVDGSTLIWHIPRSAVNLQPAENNGFQRKPTPPVQRAASGYDVLPKPAKRGGMWSSQCASVAKLQNASRDRQIPLRAG